VCARPALQSERITREDDSGWPCAGKGGHNGVNGEDGSGSVSRGT
jgi:hypothetical protein